MISPERQRYRRLILTHIKAPTDAGMQNAARLVGLWQEKLTVLAAENPGRFVLADEIDALLAEYEALKEDPAGYLDTGTEVSPDPDIDGHPAEENPHSADGGQFDQEKQSDMAHVPDENSPDAIVPKSRNRSVYFGLLALGLAAAGVVLMAKMVPGLMPGQPQSIVIDMSDWSETLVTGNCRAPFSTDNNTPVQLLEENGNAIISYSKEMVICAQKTINIDANARYTMKVRYKVQSTDGSEAKVKALSGVMTFDGDGTLETGAPGAHRYGTSGAIIASSDEWKESVDVFQGKGPDPLKFRETTETARPMVFFQTVSGNPLISVDYIEIRETF